MGILDRLTSPRAARALWSWRIALGVGVGVALAVAGLPIGVAVAVGSAMFAASVGAALAGERSERPAIDPFAVGEPWRQLVQRALSAERTMRDTVGRMSPGPLRDTMVDIARQVGRGVDEAWAVARRGDEIDDAVRRLDPTSLSSRLATAEERARSQPSDDARASVESIRRQIESAERLRRRSADTADTLRLTQTRLDELVARASEVQVGVVDTTAYRNEVDELVIRLEALHLAIQETERA